MTEEKISYKLIFFMLSMFMFGVSLEYAYMDKVMQQESIAMFSYTCDVRFGEGGWQTQRINYNTWVCLAKTAPLVLNESVNYSSMFTILPQNNTLRRINESNRD